MGVIRNIGWGVRWGVRMGLLFCAWVLILVLVEGSPTLQLREGYAVPALSVIALYALGGPCAGAIVGLFRPLLQWRAGAVLAGTLAALPLFLGVRVMMFGFAPWGMADTVIVLGGSPLLGPLTALLIGEANHEIEAAERTKHRAGKRSR
jgi:hypothetical protein